MASFVDELHGMLSAEQAAYFSENCDKMKLALRLDGPAYGIVTKFLLPLFDQVVFLMDMSYKEALDTGVMCFASAVLTRNAYVDGPMRPIRSYESDAISDACILKKRAAKLYEHLIILTPIRTASGQSFTIEQGGQVTALNADCLKRFVNIWAKWLKQKAQIDGIIEELRRSHDDEDEAIRQHKSISTLHD